MAWRDPLWLGRALDALKATLNVDPVTKTEMIRFLITEGFWVGTKLTEEAAHTKFNACMNPGKPEFFKLTELWVLMKRFQRFDLLHTMVEDLGFEQLVPIPRAVRREDLVQRLEKLRQQRDDEEALLLTELQLLESPETSPGTALDQQGIVRIHPALRDPGVRFSLPEDDGHASGGF